MGWFQRSPDPRAEAAVREQRMRDQQVQLRLMVRAADAKDARERRRHRQTLQQAEREVQAARMDRARILSEQAVRHKHKALRHYRFARRIEGVLENINEAVETGALLEGLGDMLAVAGAAGPSPDRMANVDAMLFESSADTAAARDALESAGLAADAVAGTDEAAVAAEALELFEELCDHRAVELSGSLDERLAPARATRLAARAHRH
ncbi:Hypothetical Protein FCC1311_048262 [Hondaea fermentalgiana]|uniref:Uncharacterized protein n=1 Tax=Hondaea fermentalgiana TaxID=2315210 RepID=A0A2R5GDG2_9STRA|nr:Hypothetical Protein FCC1311_048262 [Hondaea fermentalgiana]|eukprot:GBG28605.1 Hypothetical Protein FCC1311_048262 [Hondaea fermentalgiana]